MLKLEQLKNLTYAFKIVEQRAAFDQAQFLFEKHIESQDALSQRLHEAL
jgi:hypothetical protein